MDRAVEHISTGKPGSAELNKKEEGMIESTAEHKEQVDKQTEWARTLWYAYLTGDNSQLDTKVRIMRRTFKVLPSDPRCRVCNAPFSGIGGVMVRPFGWGAGRSSFNRSLCDRCEKIVKKYQVGVELRLTMLF